MFIAEDFLPIQSLEIFTEKKINFDLFVNLPLNQKFILYHRKGQALDPNRMVKFTEKEGQIFYIRKEEYNDFVKYAALRISSLIGVEGTEQNLKVMMKTAKMLMNSTVNQDDPAVVQVLMTNLNDITGMILDSLLETSNVVGAKRTFNKLAELSSKGTDFQKHPINVASLAVFIAFGMGYNTDRILADLAMAALLHDVGLAKLSARVIDKAHTPWELTREDRQGLYMHPFFTMDTLSARNIKITPMAEMIIMQHHEQYNGSGYPNGLRGPQLNEFAQVLCFADELDHLISKQFTSRTNLKLYVMNLFDRFAKDKVIDPLLLTRIRSVIL